MALRWRPRRQHGRESMADAFELVALGLPARDERARNWSRALAVNDVRDASGSATGWLPAGHQVSLRWRR
jgi:hypothetical protein